MIIGLNLDRFIITGDRFILAVEMCQNQAAIVPTVVVFGVECQCPIVYRQRGGITLKFEQGFTLEVPNGCRSVIEF